MRPLRQSLEDAVGTTEFLIAVVADIRDFSTFSHGQESEEVALFIKRVYITLIDEYFPFGDFFKATGDGLLFGVHYDPENVRERTQMTVQACLKAVRAFPKFCRDDPMINFDAPDRIGFGIARGTACALVSDNEVIDYSGHLLNMATRLMDAARPEGVVLDESVGFDLLPAKTRRLFRPDKIYMRSVAEREPRQVYVLKNYVEIPSEYKKRIKR